MRQLVRQLASESMVYGLSAAAGGLVTVAMVPLYARVLSPAEYGVVSLVTVTLALAAIVSALALDNSAHRWFWESEDPAERRATIASWAWCHLGVALALAALLSLAAEPLARAVLGNAAAAGPLRVGAWALPAAVPTLVATNWLRMQRRPWATFALALATALGGVACTLVAVVVLGRGVRGVFEAQLAAAALGAVAASALLRGWIHPRRLRAARLREMLRFSLPLVPAAVAFWLVNMADRLFVQRYTSTSEVGVYQVGFAVASGVGLLTTAFQQAWGPFAFSILRRPDARDFYAQALLVYLAVACGAAAGASLLAPEILRVVATPAYAGAARVVAFLSFGYVMIGVSYIAALGPAIAQRTGPTGIALMGAAALNVGLNLVLTPRMGKDGAALATMVSQALACVYLFSRSQRLYPIPYRFGAAAGVVALAAAVVAVGGTLGDAEGAVALPLRVALLVFYAAGALALNGALLRAPRPGTAP